jgi:uncharacterized protein YjiS (DUF1127 family)
MTTRTLPTPYDYRAGMAPGTGWADRLRRVLQAAESRRQLAALDSRMLSDIGISRAEAIEEARRAPWDLAPRRR